MLEQTNLKAVKRKVAGDKLVRALFLLLALFCASIIVFVVAFIVIKGVTPFVKVYPDSVGGKPLHVGEFLTGMRWMAPAYGVGFIIINTILITIIALLIAVPLSIFSALLITRIAPKPVAKTLMYTVELLASIPSIIFGVFGAAIITQIVKSFGNLFNYQTAGGLSMLAGGIVLALMIYPTITMLSISSINAVGDEIIHGSLALGASETETNFKVVLTSAKSGIFAGIILGVGRALGEATAVSMVVGNAGTGPTWNPLDPTRTLTTTMLQSLHEVSSTSIDYEVRFSVGIILMVVIIATNLALNSIKRRVGNIK
ncbi:MAG: phosphate ABC transporter permease subunit PstC [Erysipelotrichaceae bacterium]|nr:phosphate ABC transporter permease subunit PstC [Erysipelotrichaceae bacterium]